MEFINATQLLQLCEKENISISEAMLRRELTIGACGREQALAEMDKSWGVMKTAIVQSLEYPQPSMGGLIGGEAQKMQKRMQTDAPLCGTLMARAVCYALGVLEINASMGLIVAAPTAGSSGVLPGALKALQEEFSYSDEDIVLALFNAAAVGYLITKNATVSGAEGGCQAEVGAAAAMAASAAVELAGGGPAECLSAACIAISNLLGLVCDPVCGLVEEPCQKRNAIGVANALTAAEMTMAGIAGVVPFDEMVEVMRRVGQSLPMELRETALGGVAAAPTACKLCGMQ